jgi:dihydroneopterin aldolase
MTDVTPLHQRAADEAGEAREHIFIRNLVLSFRIGVHPHEQEAPQRVRINLDLQVADDGKPIDDNIRRVVSYEKIVQDIRALAQKGHVNLVETLAERIAQLCLRNRRAERVRVRVEKLDVYEDAESVGVELERRRQPR